mgnify:CR=1 FL=1
MMGIIHNIEKFACCYILQSNCIAIDKDFLLLEMSRNRVAFAPPAWSSVVVKLCAVTPYLYSGFCYLPTATGSTPSLGEATYPPKLQLHKLPPLAIRPSILKLKSPHNHDATRHNAVASQRGDATIRGLCVRHQHNWQSLACCT